MEGDADMNEVVPGIFLGNISAANNTDQLKEHGVTHILTINATPLDKSQVSDVVYKYIQKLDMPEVDLLSHFSECFEFIDSAFDKKGKILVHCLAGASRSATIVVGYLMFKHSLSLEEALYTVKKKRVRMRPNPGFMEQLELFEQMDGKIDPDHPLYRRYKLNVLAHRIQSGSIDELQASELGNTDISRSESFYRCKKCRQALFKHSSLLTHNLGEGEAAFDWRCKAPGAPRPAADTLQNQSGQDKKCDQSLFIEPVRWMADAIIELEGKLMCPKCQAKLGSFVWYGEKCPCGTWVAPAFHIQTSKVDCIKPMPSMGIQQRTLAARHVHQGKALVSQMSQDNEAGTNGEIIDKSAETDTISDSVTQLCLTPDGKELTTQ